MPNACIIVAKYNGSHMLVFRAPATTAADTAGQDQPLPQVYAELLCQALTDSILALC